MIALRNIGFVGGLIMLAVGLWWERPSLALIVPGGVLLAMLCYGTIRNHGGQRR